jgi:hypothetical protein
MCDFMYDEMKEQQQVKNSAKARAKEIENVREVTREEKPMTTGMK